MGIFGFSACDPGTGTGAEVEKKSGFFFDEQAFISNWNEWINNNIQNYGFTMTGMVLYRNISRALPMREYKVNVVVKNGVMDSFEYIGYIPYEYDGITIEKPEFTSISDMYQKIDERAKYEREWWKKNTGGGIVSTTLRLTYDTQLHYINYFVPVTEVKPGWILDTTNHVVTISNFTVLSNE